MSQDLADSLKAEFYNLTEISCNAVYMEKGINHNPTKLTNEKGVYVFLDGDNCFKVGRAGANSQARWNSHHYNLDDTTPSTFPKSIINNLELFKPFFPETKHAEIDDLKPENIRTWIRNNVSRMEFKIPSVESSHALNLLEALLQFKLRPLFEGKMPQRLQP